MDWPPKLESLKGDLGIDEEDTRDDDTLSRVLDAAVAFVEQVHEKWYRFEEDDSSSSDDLPEPDAAVYLGTIRLASRWHTRRRSPDGLVEMAELGSSSVPRVDPDIERMLKIGRYRRAVFA